MAYKFNPFLGKLDYFETVASAGDGYNPLAAGSQTAASTGSVVFSNSNNVSFGMSNNSVITASATQSAINVSVSGNNTDANVYELLKDGFGAGWIAGGTFSTQTSGSTISIGSGEGIFRTANDPHA